MSKMDLSRNTCFLNGKKMMVNNV